MIKKKMFVTSGRSMFPAILPGREVVILHRKARFGDVCVFLYHAGLNSHRFLFYFKGKAVTKGDNNLCYESISKSKVVGIIRSGNIFSNSVVALFSLFQGFWFLVFDFLRLSFIFRNRTAIRIFKFMTNPLLYVFYFQNVARDIKNKKGKIKDANL